MRSLSFDVRRHPSMPSFESMRKYQIAQKCMRDKEFFCLYQVCYGNKGLFRALRLIPQH